MSFGGKGKWRILSFSDPAWRASAPPAYLRDKRNPAGRVRPGRRTTAGTRHRFGTRTASCSISVPTSRSPRIRESRTLFARYVDDKYEAVQVKLDNYWRGLRLTHPVQLHLNGLPHDLIVEIIADFVKEHGKSSGKINNYEDWLLASYGRKFAETFPMQYTRKYHLTEASNMSTDWLGPRMYRPSLEEMLRGALAPWTPEVHYITNFRYPTNGGFVSYLRDFPSIADHQVSSTRWSPSTLGNRSCASRTVPPRATMRSSPRSPCRTSFR